MSDEDYQQGYQFTKKGVTRSLGTIVYRRPYHKRGKIRWAKLSRFSRFSRALRKFLHEYLYKLLIIAFFEWFKRMALQKFFREKLYWGGICESLAQRIFPSLQYFQ